MTGRRHVITMGVTDGLVKEETKAAIRDSVKLVQETFEGIGYETVNVGGLNPSANSLREQLRSFGATRNAQDLVVLYHIGHADSLLGEHRLRMGGMSNDPYQNSVRTADIATWLLNGTELCRLLIILETCHAAHGVSDMTRAIGEIVKGRQRKSVVFISASHPTELIVPGHFAPLLARHLRRDAAFGTATPKSVVVAIQQDEDRPSWQTVSHNVMFETEEVPFFLFPEGVGSPEHDFDCILAQDERERLIAILDGLPVYPSGKELAKLVQAAEEYLRAVPSGGISDVFSYVERLDQMWTRPGQIPPLLAFLEFLAARYSNPHGAELRTLVRSVATRLKIPAPALEKMEHSAISSAGAPLAPVLVVVRAEHDLDLGAYTLTASLLLSPAGLPDKREATVSCAADQIQENGEQLLDQIGTWLAEVDDPGDLTVEFAFPFHLIDHPVDEWRIGIGRPAETELGLWSIVVVRPTDCRQGWGQASSRKRWAKLTGGWAEAEPEVGWMHREPAASWNREEDIVLGGCTNRQVLARLNQAKGISCIALSYPHPAAEGQSGAVDGLYLALTAGIPVAIWRRDGGDVEPLRGMLDEMAQKHTLNTLPARVRDLRNEGALAESNHLGRHLTLVWNSPEHPNRSGR